VADGRANTLTGFDGGLATRQTHLLAQHGRVRTLTLTEWERLNGFPDGWTAMAKDSARYTAIGNAMHVGTAAWLGRRISAVHHALPQLDTRSAA
jgi:DNA (cytosine-5)-methyltransferase 1